LHLYLKGYIAHNSTVQQPAQIQYQQSLNCQPAIALSSAQCIQPQQQQQFIQQLSYGQSIQPQQQQQFIQQLPYDQSIQRSLSVGGGGIQPMTTQQSFLSVSNSMSPMNCSSSGTQFY
jgi:hypothetical protein